MEVFIPAKETSLFNMYCYSYIVDKKYVENYGTFLYTKGIAVILYKYKGFKNMSTRSDYRKGYVVKKHTENSGIKGYFLPSIDNEVDILYQAEGRRVDLLKNMTFNLLKMYGENIFLTKEYYWLSMVSLLNHFNGKKCAATKANIAILDKRLIVENKK